MGEGWTMLYLFIRISHETGSIIKKKVAEEKRGFLDVLADGL